MGLVILEGVDGCGKTTLAKGLSDYLQVKMARKGEPQLPIFNFSFGPPFGEYGVYEDAAFERGMLLKSAEIFAKLLERSDTVVISDRFHLSTFAYGIVKRYYPRRLAELVTEEVDKKLIELFRDNIKVILLAFKDPEHNIPKRKDITKEYVKSLKDLVRINGLYEEAIYKSELPRYTFYIDNVDKDRLLEDVIEFLGWNK